MLEDLLIVCTFTADTIYEDEARRMVESAERFGYQARAIETPEQGDWRRNVGIKPKYNYDAVLQHSGPVLSLDSDCLVLKPLDELFELAAGYDIAVKCRPDTCFTALFNAAVLLIQPTAAAHAVVREWAQRGEFYSHLHRFAEQGAFVEGMTLHQQQVRLFPLPERFHTDTVDGSPAPTDCVICHNKVSRQAIKLPPTAAQRSAVPTLAEPPSPPPHKALYCVTVPLVEQVQGRVVNGIQGTECDFHEFAKRHGIEHIGRATIDREIANSPGYDLKKLEVIAKLCEQVPAGTPVVLANYDTLFLRDPILFETVLKEHDLALAWDHQDPRALPSLAVFSMRLGSKIAEGLLPALRAECQRLATAGVRQFVLEQAMNHVLRDHALGLAIAALPSEITSDMSAVTVDTTVLAVRSQLQFQPQGTAPCPPLSCSQPTLKNNAYTKSA